MARSALAIGVAALLALTVRAGITASFEHGDVPVELLVYTQTSPQIPELRDRIDALARETGMGYNLPIEVDGTDGFAWPWVWYLRNYHAVSYIPPPTAGYQPPANSVALIARSNRALIDSEGFGETPYKHRWWFEETYRGKGIGHNLRPGDFARILTSPKELKAGSALKTSTISRNA